MKSFAGSQTSEEPGQIDMRGTVFGKDPMSVVEVGLNAMLGPHVELGILTLGPSVSLMLTPNGARLLAKLLVGAADVVEPEVVPKSLQGYTDPIDAHRKAQSDALKGRP